MATHGFEQAFEAVGKLVADFRANYDFYLSAAYSEAQVRKDFIDKFFVALGWDVNNEWHPNPFEQEVKVEKPVAGGETHRRADYAFFVAPIYRDPRFIAEAKKPYGELATADNYFQAVRYGWNLQNPLVGLTDFEHFHLLDCRFKPHIDTALHRCVEKWSLDDYGDREKFSRLYWLISREAVTNGSLEKFTADLPKPRGKGKQRGIIPGAWKGIDESFLEDLDLHRNTLARALKKYNPQLDSEILTETTQRALDRLVFMRFLEDKLIEPSRFVESFGKRGTAWQDFVAASRRLDRIYNGIVFKKHPILDSPDFRLDDAAFEDVCGDLSNPNSPYDFNAIPIHILGSIYERFLGNVIVATDKRVRVEQKPEVRKAGGVFYTPEYIVRYIVENTVGKLIAGKTPKEIAELRFVDIACGSGSFLLGVYDLLLRYHSQYYNSHPRKAGKGECVNKDGVLHLSVEKKREILLNNIFGVDIDFQAVEVTQLSLYLKLLDEETIASTHDYQLKLHAAILPPLDKNIVCGNSIIGRDISNGHLFDDDDVRKLNPMSFSDAFPLVMRRGGFNAVVGNPPYGAQADPHTIEYCRRKYRSVANSLDTFIMFMENASNLLMPNGVLGYIIPSGWASTPSCRKLRVLFSERMRPNSFVSLPYDVFTGAYIDTMIVTAHRLGAEQSWKSLKDKSVKLVVFPIRHRIGDVREFDEFAKKGDFSNWLEHDEAEFLVTASKVESDLIAKLRREKLTVDSVVDVMRGIETYNPSSSKGMSNPVRAFTGDIRRYSCVHGKRAFVDYTSEIESSKPLRFFSEPRILLRQLVSRKFRLQAVFTDERFLTNQSVQSLVAKPNADDNPSLLAVLGVLNSMLVSWYFCQVNAVARRDDFPKTTIRQTRAIPFPQFRLNSDSGRKLHGRMVRLVEQLLSANQHLPEARSEHARAYYEKQCASLDHQIDELVYELYSLTAEEIRIVEGSKT